jgi:hypothetical protein
MYREKSACSSLLPPPLGTSSDIGKGKPETRFDLNIAFDLDFEFNLDFEFDLDFEY